ncbi:MAG: hypothetical protein JSW73_00430 [Candidatus Woesearchaeota archaeon]|nr:MAG: hypothetical protein JSW73_00430 [Candidatus Woesearchaeota archaeon]
MKLPEFTSELENILKKSDLKYEDFDKIGLTTDNAGTMWIDGNSYYNPLINHILTAEKTVKMNFDGTRSNRLEPTEHIVTEPHDYTIVGYKFKGGYGTELVVRKYLDRIECSLHGNFNKKLEGNTKRSMILDVLKANASLLLLIIQYINKNSLKAHFTSNPELEE